MARPTFLVLGVPKAGTTSLHYYLQQHPEIFMCHSKEPHFFAYGEAPLPIFKGPGAHRLKDRVTGTWDAYQALFAGVTKEVACGEVSTTNIMPRACERIRRYLPDARLVVILRQPAERAYSQYMHIRRLGWEPHTDFADALAAEEQRRQENWQPVFLYTEPGYYFADLQRYFNTFHAEQIRVYLYEEWKEEPVKLLQDLFHFIGVDEDFVPDMRIQHNVGGLPRSQWLNHWLRNPTRSKEFLKHLMPRTLQRSLVQTLLRRNLEHPPAFDPALRAELTERYRDDILQVQKLLQRDLSHWLVTDTVNVAKTH